MVEGAESVGFHSFGTSVVYVASMEEVEKLATLDGIVKA